MAAHALFQRPIREMGVCRDGESDSLRLLKCKFGSLEGSLLTTLKLDHSNNTATGYPWRAVTVVSSMVITIIEEHPSETRVLFNKFYR